MMVAISSKENAKPDEEVEGKKVMKKGMTKSLKELKDLPVETLVKIFNYLPNHDIRCRVSLVCQKFLDICQNQSLVPVKDLSIHGYKYWSDDPTSYGKASFDDDEKVSNPERAFDVDENDDIFENFNGSEIELMFATTYRKQLFGLRNIETVTEVIIQSAPNLTSLKIKELDYASINDLVEIALEHCPKLIHLEIGRSIIPSDKIFHKNTYDAMDDGDDDDHPAHLMCMIEEFGKNLRSIKLSVNRFLLDLYEDHFANGRALHCIANECLKLETLILEAGESSRPQITPMGNLFFSTFSMSFQHLDQLSINCKELKELKITGFVFDDFLDESEIKEIFFPNCNVELKDCLFGNFDGQASCEQCGMYLDDCLCSGNFYFPYDPSNSDFDDQDSNYGEADDILDNFDGSEIELLFTQDYEGHN